MSGFCSQRNAAAADAERRHHRGPRDRELRRLFRSEVDMARLRTPLLKLQPCCQTWFFLKDVIFLWKKNKNENFIIQKRTISSIFSANFQTFFKCKKHFSGFTVLWGIGLINLQNTSSPLNYYFQSASILIENIWTYPNIRQKVLHFKVFSSFMSSKFPKKGQNLFFKELKEHFWRKIVL